MSRFHFALRHAEAIMAVPRRITAEGSFSTSARVKQRLRAKSQEAVSDKSGPAQGSITENEMERSSAPRLHRRLVH